MARDATVGSRVHVNNDTALGNLPRQLDGAVSGDVVALVVRVLSVVIIDVPLRRISRLLAKLAPDQADGGGMLRPRPVEVLGDHGGLALWVCECRVQATRHSLLCHWRKGAAWRPGQRGGIERGGRQRGGIERGGEQLSGLDLYAFDLHAIALRVRARVSVRLRVRVSVRVSPPASWWWPRRPTAA